MDRIDAMTAFVQVVDQGSFSAAARHLNRSAASITRAVALLEARTATRLLVRTTRAIKLTSVGARYLDACRRVLAELQAAEELAVEDAAPRGELSVTAPATFGVLHVRPLVSSLLSSCPDVRVRLLLVDRVVHLVEEGVDVAVRIAHLPDSGLVAAKVGEVRRVLCASPDYLSRKGKPRSPTDLAAHDTIAFTQPSSTNTWTFQSSTGRPRPIRVSPRLSVNAAQAAIDAAVEGHGITHVLSYQVEQELRAGRLVRLLAAAEQPAVPVHVVYPATRVVSPKLRAFLDLVVPGLRKRLR